MYIPSAQKSNYSSDNPPSNRILIIIIALMSFFVIVSHCSCYTPAKAKRQALRAMTQHPEQVLPTLRQLAPCITVNVDTFYTTVDTTITVDCPDTSAAQYFTVHDTLMRIKQVTKTVPISHRIQLPARTVVKYIKDSAEIMEANLRIKRIESERDSAIKREKETADKLSKSKKQNTWLWLALIVCLLIMTRKKWFPVLGRMSNTIS